MIATTTPSFDAKIVSNGIRALCIHFVTVEVEDHPPARSQRCPLHKPPLLLRSRIRQLQPKTHAIQSASQSQRDLRQPPARTTRTPRRLPAAQAPRTKHSLADQSPFPKLTTPREPPTGANSQDEYAETYNQSPEPREVRSPRIDRFVPERGPKCALSHASKWQALKSLRSIRQGDKRPQ
jgi:hypothetical protein